LQQTIGGESWRVSEKEMAEIEWKPLPRLWPSPAVYTDIGEFMLLVFTQEGVPGRAYMGSLPQGSQRK